MRTKIVIDPDVRHPDVLVTHGSLAIWYGPWTGTSLLCLGTPADWRTSPAHTTMVVESTRFHVETLE